jgi:transcriptional regulator with XRE-family HTH domain
VPTIGDIASRNVRAERARRGWKQAELAARLSWSVTKVGDVETGRRRVTADQLVELCRAFSIPLRRLLDGADPEDLQALGIEPLT